MTPKQMIENAEGLTGDLVQWSKDDGIGLSDLLIILAITRRNILSLHPSDGLDLVGISQTADSIYEAVNKPHLMTKN